MDKFVENTEPDTCTGADCRRRPGLVMDYYDGNTVTALWNYAQHFAMSDNSFDTDVRPVDPGRAQPGLRPDPRRLRVDPDRAGQRRVRVVAGRHGVGTVIRDPTRLRRLLDSHATPDSLAVMPGTNIGDLLNAKDVTWGWFQGGFTPTASTADGTAVCGATHTERRRRRASATTSRTTSRSSTTSRRPTRTTCRRPRSATIGHTDQANHQYDLTDFDAALDAGNLPAVSFLKAAAYQDGHAGYSDPLDEQHFLVEHDQRAPEVAGVDEHRGRHRLRRLRRLVRPRRCRRSSTRRSDRRRRARPAPARAAPTRPARRLPGPLRLRPAPAAAGHLAVRQDELRRPHPDRPDLDPALHRGQLADRPDRRPLLRRPRRLARTTCSTSTAGRTRRRCSSTRHRPARPLTDPKHDGPPQSSGRAVGARTRADQQRGRFGAAGSRQARVGLDSTGVPGLDLRRVGEQRDGALLDGGEGRSAIA